MLKGEDVSLGVARVFFCALGAGWLFVVCKVVVKVQK